MSPDDVTKPLDGYALGEVIGVGGIGEIITAHDLRVGRDVAIKRLKTAAPTADESARFLREARIQARLPAISCVVIMSVMAYPIFIERSFALIALIAIGFLVPIILELTDVIPRTWEIKDSTLISHAGALELSGTPTLTMLIGASIATIVIAGVHAGRIYRASREANRALVMQSWHLRQLLPT